MASRRDAVPSLIFPDDSFLFLLGEVFPSGEDLDSSDDLLIKFLISTF